MTKKTFAWIFVGGSVATSAALGLVACSDPAPAVVPSVDASRPDTSSNSDTGTGGDTSTPPPQDAGADCAKAPNFHPTPEAGPFCPFQKAADGGALFGECALGSHCCLYAQNSMLPSTCNTAQTACADAGTADFECEESSDCVGIDMVCCLKGSVKKDPVCGTYFGSLVNGTTCRKTTCMPMETLVCDSAQATCPAGQTCQPFKTKSIELGGCTM